jgi:nanoRNase/pAp phosphatase (c-di-AMP/oligoRNAs hydrolase)
MNGRSRAANLQSDRCLKDVLPARGRVLIIPHDYPDPDALASAAALHLLLDRAWHVRSAIVFAGVVNRAENQEMLRHFRYRWRPMEDFPPPSRKLPAIFLDVWPGPGHVTMPPWIRPIGVIDHHPPRMRAVPEGWFVDVRPGIGATATLLYGRLREAGVEPPPWLAAVMAYAIETETLAFTRPYTPEDRDAYTALIQVANLRIIGAIRNAPLKRAHFSRLREALANARLHAHVAWTHLPQAEPPELVAEVADLLLRLERMTWSFCTGERADELLVSVRSERRDARCGRIVREAVRGDGIGGGHDRMAAGVISLAGLAPAQREERLRRLQTALLRRMIPRKLSVDIADPEQIGRALA